MWSNYNVVFFLFKATEESIEEYFKQFGGIRKVCVINPCYSGRYFAFVWFNQAVDAAKALAVRNHYIHQRKIRVKPAYSEHQESDDDNCYSEDSDDLFYRDYDPDFWIAVSNNVETVFVVTVTKCFVEQKKNEKFYLLNCFLWK